MLKCEARLKIKFKCVSVTMYSLVMSPFSRDLMLTCVQYLHSAWLLDGIASILLYIALNMTALLECFDLMC